MAGWQPQQRDPRQPGPWGNPPPQYPQAPPARQPSARTYKIAARRQKSTAVHGILTLVTAGLWSPVWIMACAENSRIRRAQAEVSMYEAAVQRRY